MGLHRKVAGQQYENQETGPSVASVVTEQPWGNAAMAERLGLGKAPTLDDALAPWSSGPQGDLLDSDLLAPALGSDLGFDELRDLLDNEGIDQELVTWFDLIVPPGAGIKGALSLGAAMQVTFELGGGVTVVNLGGGYWDVEVEGSLSAGAAEAIGLAMPMAEGKAEVGAEVKVEGSFGLKLPWARLMSGAKVQPTGLAQVVDGVASALHGVDLLPYVMSVEVQTGAEAKGEVAAGLVGQEISNAIKMSGDASVGVSFDDLTAPDGTRDGEIRIEAEAEALAEIAVNLAAGYLPRLHEATALVVPFTWLGHGDTELHTPYVVLGADAEVGMVGVGATLELGPNHSALKASVMVHPGTLLWDKVLEGANLALMGMSLGAAKIDAEGTVELGLSISADGAMSALLHDVWAWLATGSVSEALAPYLGEAQAIVKQAQITLAVDLVLAELTVEGEVEGGLGPKVGVEGEAKAALLYQRDDVMAELDAPPTIDDALAMIRRSAAAAVA
ncbi:MAG: hypothetical protein H6738_11940 [Alphaproteobacteria bacterium]|nr:hypothetical protein [Alphaproteobacteria bacterium]MCB9697483.1 hypothetical protein [Alphaproteobacteria bacterium]